MKAAARMAVLTLLACALVAATLIAAPAAKAQTSFDDNRVPFGGVNGEAFSVRAVGDQLWVGGTFWQASDVDPSSSHLRWNLAVFDFNTGNVLPWSLDTNHKVKAIESDDTSTVWVAGNFTQIAGQDVTYVAAIDAFTGQVLNSFNVALDNEANALHYDQGWLYIAGEFNTVNGLNYPMLVRVDAVSGALDTSFAPSPDAQVHSIDVFGDRVYAGGDFETVGTRPNDVNRRWVAAFDTNTGAPAGPQFALPPLNPGEASHRAGVLRVHVSTDGDYLYTADKRNFVTQWDRATGQEIWDQRAAGDIQAVVTDGTSVFVGTHDGFLDSGDERLLFALNETDGSQDTSFQPLQNRYWGTRQLVLAQGALVAVGDFTTVKSQPAQRVAVFHGPGWTGAQPLAPPFILGDVSCDDVADIGDALMIAQYSVGLRTEAASCGQLDPTGQIGPGGDVNDDGSIDVGDALLVAQCTVAISNVFCPG